jgi:hypothetical protein
MPLVVILLFVAAAQAPGMGLTKEKCIGEVVVAAMGFRAVGTCEELGDGTRLSIKVSNPEPTLRLRAFSFGFCGLDIARAIAPPGWEVDVRGEGRISVDWNSTREDAVGGLAPGETLDGFILELKPGWRRSSYASAVWDGSGTGGSMTHDCSQN